VPTFQFVRVARHLTVLGSTPLLPAIPESFAPEGSEAGLPPLLDQRGRRYDYLRFSVTDRCDFACVYCMPPGGEDDHALRPDLLTFEEAANLIVIFQQLGIRRVRFTGGEPLVRRDVVQLIELVRRRTGLEQLVMTTNASRLAELALPLKQAGLAGVNISLDSLDPERFRTITRGGSLKRVLAGVHAALDAGLNVKLNIVALGGLNADEAPQLVEWAWERGITPRFIELMPLGEASNLPQERFVTHAELIARLGLAGVLRGVAGNGPARYLEGRGGRVGFITAVSDEFCASCNRVRVTARGDMRACLASRSGVSLRDAMRGGASDRELAWLIHAAMGSKLAGHTFTDAEQLEHQNVGMSLVGG
jgi:cyclic pyranopterin phosphate synthase